MNPVAAAARARWSRVGVAVACLAATVVLYQVSMFLVIFEVLGPPVRDNTHGWLGPTPRQTGCVEDMGKMNYWNCPDVSVFQHHQLGCRVWLWANGFKIGA